MEGVITPQTLYEAYHQRLGLHWLNRPRGDGATIDPQLPAGEEYSLIGHLNFIHPHRIQLLGKSELTYLAGLKKNTREDTLQQLFDGSCALVIVAGGDDAPRSLLREAKQRDIAVFASPLSSHKLIADIGYYLRSHLADTLVIHGVFMEVMGIGVLLTGESAIGKSELALELITRGHRLVADDAPLFRRNGPDTLMGSCPRALENFLEVRGLGILNVRALFGDSAIKPKIPLQLIVQLTPVGAEGYANIDRLRGSRHSRRILEVEVPEVELPVAPGRNLAVLVEAAARNQILYNGGYDAAEDFITRQQRLIQDSSE